MSWDGDSSFPLEANAEAVRVFDVELLHAVMPHAWRFHSEALFTQEIVGGIHIGTTDVEAGIVVRVDVGRIGRRWAVILFVACIEHELSAWTLEPAPIDIVGRTRRGCAEDFKAEDVAVKADGSGHVEDLQEWADTLECESHWDLLNQ
jgi:hypothetical protein